MKLMKFKNLIPKNLLDEYNHFNRHYLVEKSFKVTEDVAVEDSGSQACRFCKKREPEVTFNMKAHLVPALISDFSLVYIRALKGKIFFKTPAIYFFSKQDNGMDWYPDKTLVLLWGRQTFQIPIFSDKNLNYYKHFETLGCPFHPIIINYHTPLNIQDKQYFTDLDNSTKEVKNFSCNKIVKDDTVQMEIKSNGFLGNEDINFNKM